MKIPVYIASMASASPLGENRQEIWNNYKHSEHYISRAKFGDNQDFAAFLSDELKKKLDEFCLANPDFRSLDDSVLYAIYVSRMAVEEAQWEKGANIGINIGSSRGATGLFEQYHSSFIKSGKAETLASPTTTLGNISSWVSQDLQSSGPEISHSVTCSTGLHAILNAVAWLQAGMADKFLAGGSEAALTPFTIAQMKAMKIYASEERDYPCQALNIDKTRNSMILGEGAAVVCLETNPKKKLAKIKGIGYATEQLKHPASISANAICFQRSMKMALGNLPLKEIDAVVMHAPGTVKGDLAEYNAVKEVFGDKLPALTSNKWKVGHTFGASGVLSLELGILMLQNQEFIPVPFSEISRPPERLENILINAVGFGGNAVSVLISRN